MYARIPDIRRILLILHLLNGFVLSKSTWYHVRISDILILMWLFSHFYAFDRRLRVRLMNWFSFFKLLCIIQAITFFCRIRFLILLEHICNRVLNIRNRISCNSLYLKIMAFLSYFRIMDRIHLLYLNYVLLFPFMYLCFVVGNQYINLNDSFLIDWK